jgi:hypothetical protein
VRMTLEPQGSPDSKSSYIPSEITLRDFSNGKVPAGDK